MHGKIDENASFFFNICTKAENKLWQGRAEAGSLPALLAGMHLSAAAVGNSLAFPQNVRHTVTA